MIGRNVVYSSGSGSSTTAVVVRSAESVVPGSFTDVAVIVTVSVSPSAASAGIVTSTVTAPDSPALSEILGADSVLVQVSPDNARLKVSATLPVLVTQTVYDTVVPASPLAAISPDISTPYSTLSTTCIVRGMGGTVLSYDPEKTSSAS